MSGGFDVSCWPTASDIPVSLVHRMGQSGGRAEPGVHIDRLAKTPVLTDLLAVLE